MFAWATFAVSRWPRRSSSTKHFPSRVQETQSSQTITGAQSRMSKDIGLCACTCTIHIHVTGALG